MKILKSLMVIMIGAIVTIKGGMGYGNGGYELDSTLLLASVGVLCAGAGRYTIMKFPSSKSDLIFLGGISTLKSERARLFLVIWPR